MVSVMGKLWRRRLIWERLREASKRGPEQICVVESHGERGLFGTKWVKGWGSFLFPFFLFLCFSLLLHSSL